MSTITTRTGKGKALTHAELDDNFTNLNADKAETLADVGVTATIDEVNLLDGATLSTAELNLLDGVTSTTAELNILDGVTSTAAELNILDGVTSTTAELNILDGVTATTAELNIMDGVTATTAELNYVDGVTSAIQTQIDTKAPIAGASLTGTTSFESLSDGTITVTAFVDEDDMSSNSAGLVPTQQSVKAYVDSQVTAQDLDVTSDSGTIAIDLDSETMTIAGGEGIDTSATGNTVTVTAEQASDTNKGIASFDADDFRFISGQVHLSVSAASFGAVGDGSTDDTQELQDAIDSVTVSGAWLDGGNKTYKITGTINATGEFLRLRNFKFVIQTTYSSTGRFECKRTTNTNKMTVAFENVFVDGGRGTYKTGSEPWTDINYRLFGYDSIAPTLGAFLKVEAYNSDTTVHVTNCLFENYHGIAGVRVNSFGTTVIEGCVFRNMSFQSFITYQAYFDANDVITYQEGTTLVSDVYAEDIGLLPDTFLVDGVTKNFSNTDYAPHTSYNFAAIGANYSINNASVKNYASTGVLGDRNQKFIASNINIINDSDRSFSNNPSGAFWIEACEQSNVNNLTVDIIARAARDTLEDTPEDPRGLDNCLVQIYLRDGNKAFFNNVFLKSDASTAYVNKFIRGSCKHDTLCSITNFHVEGTCRNLADAISFLLIPGSQIQQDVRLAHGYLSHGDIKIDNPHNVTIDDVYLAGGYSATVASTALVTDTLYEIVTVGSTDFTTVGAVSNTVGVRFKATGTASGTGTVSTVNGNITPFRAANASGASRTAAQIRARNTYKITASGTTDFTTFGATDSNVGTVFIATADGSDGDTTTGTAQLFIPDETHDFSVHNCYIYGDITNNTNITETLSIASNKRVGAITSQGASNTNSGRYLISGNSDITGAVQIVGSGSTGASKVEVANNARLQNIVLVTGVNSAVVTGNVTERRIEIQNVEHFQVTGNTAKTARSEPSIYINPSDTTKILSGTITGNNCLMHGATLTAGSFIIGTTYEIISLGNTVWTDIGYNDQSGTDPAAVGDTFVATGIGSGTGTAKPIAGGGVSVKNAVVNVMEGLNNELTVNWS